MEPKILVYSVINSNINRKLYLWKLLTSYEKTQAVPIGGPWITEWAERSLGHIFFTGNLTIVTEEYRKVCDLQLNTLAERYAYVRSYYGQIEKLEPYITPKTNEKYPTWFQTACKDHRLFLLRQLDVSRVSRGLEWEFMDKRQKKQKSRKSLKLIILAWKNTATSKHKAEAIDSTFLNKLCT